MVGESDKKGRHVRTDGQAQQAAHAAEGQTRAQSRYVPAIDGLRAFAVLAVISYHMNLGWAPGGLMGVTVFFVISGYLINGLLVAERESTGSVNLANFWLRRVRRLFPAILLSVVGTLALCTLFNHTLLDKMRPDILPSLLFYNNWWQIVRDVSYFEAAGAPSPLTHFWSLSIEEQFYVVWPLLLVAMYHLGLKKKSIARIALGLALISALAMAMLFDPHGDPSRIYYGTDTRAMSLLLGIWLSIMWPSAAFGEGGKSNAQERNGKSKSTALFDRLDFSTVIEDAPDTAMEGVRPRSAARLALNLIGVGALLGLVAIVAFTNGFSAFPYYGGIALTSLLSAALIAALVVPGTWAARLFSLAPLVWVGKRSYGMYLWHFPIILLTTNVNSTAGTPWWMHLIQLALVFAVAELSFRFVEDPIRKGKLGQLWRERVNGERKHAALTVREYVPAGCFTALLVVACVGAFVVPPTNYAAQYAGGRSQKPAPSQPETAEEPSQSEDSSAETAESSDEEPANTNRSYAEIFEQQHLNDAGEPIYEPLLIGDSVSLGAEEVFYQVFPNGHLDSVVSRNIWESPYADYRDAGHAGDYVVFCLGTNNAVEDWQIDEDLLGAVESDKHVFMVNTRDTLDWLEATNDAIARTPERHPNVTVVDWYGASADHDEYFAGDGTHLTEEGAQAYIALIKEAIERSLEA